jgi:hypothetical protein
VNCRICGATLPMGAMFCGECGSSTTATPRTRRRPDPRPSDTTIIQPLPVTPSIISVPVVSVPVAVPRAVKPAPIVEPEAVVEADIAVEPDAVVEAVDVKPDGVVEERAVEEPAAVVEPGAVVEPAAVVEPGEPPPAYAPSSPFKPRHAAASEPQPASVVPPVPHVLLPAHQPPAHQPPAHQPPAAPAQVAQPPVLARFLFQFSTGETVSVQGTGLIGRRPLPQPSEVFDHLIQVNDVGMSVSKSHLEFGQHDGELWVSDRFSGNGTIIRRPGEAPMRCEPGRRYLVPRQSRVEIAEQFFVVS